MLLAFLALNMFCVNALPIEMASQDLMVFSHHQIMKNFFAIELEVHGSIIDTSTLVLNSQKLVKEPELAATFKDGTVSVIARSKTAIIVVGVVAVFVVIVIGMGVAIFIKFNFTRREIARTVGRREDLIDLEDNVDISKLLYFINDLKMPEYPVFSTGLNFDIFDF